MEILEILKSDAEYYSGVGRNYLSNSDIGTLLSDPASFGKPKEKTIAMLQGSYFHTKILEPQKLDSFVFVDASTRTTNKYKDAIADNNYEMLLLNSEKEEIDEMVRSIMGRLDFYDMIREPGNTYEVPAIGQIGGIEWKGKADIVNAEVLVDLKTTTKIEDFRFSSYKYNYDSQAYIYNQLFGKPLVFIAVEKGTNRVGLFECSDEFLDRGRAKVYKAIEVYNRFFGKNATDDVNQYYIHQTL